MSDNGSVSFHDDHKEKHNSITAHVVIDGPQWQTIDAYGYGATRQEALEALSVKVSDLFLAVEEAYVNVRRMVGEA